MTGKAFFSVRDAKRVAKATRRVERMGADLSGSRKRRILPDGPETLFYKIIENGRSGDPAAFTRHDTANAGIEAQRIDANGETAESTDSIWLDKARGAYLTGEVVACTRTQSKIQAVGDSTVIFRGIAAEDISSAGPVVISRVDPTTSVTLTAEVTCYLKGVGSLSSGSECAVMYMDGVGQWWAFSAACPAYSV
jgi:hypothetical protein